jgi:hypothetical protein
VAADQRRDQALSARLGENIYLLAWGRRTNSNFGHRPAGGPQAVRIVSESASRSVVSGSRSIASVSRLCVGGGERSVLLTSATARRAARSATDRLGRSSDRGAPQTEAVRGGREGARPRYVCTGHDGSRVYAISRMHILTSYLRPGTYITAVILRFRTEREHGRPISGSVVVSGCQWVSVGVSGEYCNTCSRQIGEANPTDFFPYKEISHIDAR